MPNDDRLELLETITRKLLKAGINPVMLEAYSRDGLPEQALSLEFFEKAIDALALAEQTFKSAFEKLPNEGRIALLALMLRMGTSQFKNKMAGSAAATAEELIALLEKKKDTLAPPGSSEAKYVARAIASIFSGRLLFRTPSVTESTPSINELRDGPARLCMGSKGVALRYVQKLLQFSRWPVVSISRPWLDHESPLGQHTINALRHFQHSMNKDDKRSASVTDIFDARIVALLETVPVKRAGQGDSQQTPPPKDDKESAWSGLIDNKEFPVKLSFEDFKTCMAFYSKLQLEPGTVTLKDLKQLKFTLGPIQKENKATIEWGKNTLQSLKKTRVDPVVKSVAESTSHTWKKLGPWGQGGVIAGGGLLIIGYGASLWNREPGKLESEALESGMPLLNKFKLESTPLPSEGVVLKRSEVGYQLKVTDSNKRFKNAKAEPLKGVGAGVTATVTLSTHKPIPADADKTTLLAQGFDDGRVWTVVRTGAHYTTCELRMALQQKSMSADTEVTEFPFAESKPVKLSDIPGVGTKVYSHAQATSVKLSSTGYGFRDPLAKEFLWGGSVEAQATLGPASLSLAATSTQSTTEDPGVPHAFVTGHVSELLAGLQLKFPVGTNTSRRTSTLGASAKISTLNKNYAKSTFNAFTIKTQAGVEWSVVHQNERSLKMTLTGAYTQTTPAATGIRSHQPEGAFQLQSTGQKFTITVDATVAPRTSQPNRSMAVRFVYHIR